MHFSFRCYPMITKLKLVFLSNVIAGGLTFNSVQAADIPTAHTELTLGMAVAIAQQKDIWLTSNRHAQEAVEFASVAAGVLPDPKISVAFANLPLDTFDFGQENMTHFKVGVAQMFPRGDSLAIKKKQLALKGQQFPYQRQDRKAKTAVTVSQLWLGAFKAQQSIALIEKDRALFEQLVDVAQASYSTALGKTRQHDIVRAQLELTRLDDRLIVLKQQQEMFRQQLNEWLDEGGGEWFSPSATLPIASKLPDIPLLSSQLHSTKTKNSPQALYEMISQHPKMRAVEHRIRASRENINLAEQQYKPHWGVNASYGYRDNNAAGQDRADLFSIGVSFDMPIFSDLRQDQQVKSAVSKTEAIKMEKKMLIRTMQASFEIARKQLLRLNQRKKLYQSILLPQVQEQSEASLTAYTNDDGDFAEVVRARISQLNASIDALGIDVDRQKTIAKLNYFFVSSDEKTN